VFLLIGGIGGWASTSHIAGAVVAAGTVLVDSSVKKVQHPTGGVVGNIRVRDGDKVEFGDVLINLDETVTRANLRIVTKQLDELAVRNARLRAERDILQSVELPRSLISRQSDAEIVEILTGERTLFESRRAARGGQKAQLNERIEQLRKEIDGLLAQQKAKTKELQLIKTELEGQNRLWSKNLIAITKYTATQREAARLDGEWGRLLASVAQARGKIAEIELQSIQLDQDRKTEVIKEIREIQSKQAELDERRVTAEDQLKRVEIRAPQAGVVHQLGVHTVGGVINAGEPVLLIVPRDDKLVIEARVAPRDIDKVRMGQRSVVSFPAFNQRTTPEVTGEISHVAADQIRDPQSNMAYFLVRITLSADELKRLDGLTLRPGMPADVYIATGERTTLSYLIKPLSDQISRAFRER
jgi:HlyD family secretion protein